MAGFNGGNGTGWYQLPYSGHGRLWKLGYFSNVLTPCRWVHRVDEIIIPAGCTNASNGGMMTAPPWGPMQGGVAINVSGPCLRPNDNIKMRSHFVELDYLGIPNFGSCTFKPASLQRQNLMKNACQKFHFGFVQVALSVTEMEYFGVNQHHSHEVNGFTPSICKYNLPDWLF